MPSGRRYGTGSRSGLIRGDRTARYAAAAMPRRLAKWRVYPVSTRIGPQPGMLKQSIADGDIDRTMCAALEEGIAGAYDR